MSSPDIQGLSQQDITKSFRINEAVNKIVELEDERKILMANLTLKGILDDNFGSRPTIKSPTIPDDLPAYMKSQLTFAYTKVNALTILTNDFYQIKHDTQQFEQPTLSQDQLTLLDYHSQEQLKQLLNLYNRYKRAIQTINLVRSNDNKDELVKHRSFNEVKSLFERALITSVLDQNLLEIPELALKEPELDALKTAIKNRKATHKQHCKALKDTTQDASVEKQAHEFLQTLVEGTNEHQKLNTALKTYQEARKLQLC